MITISYVFYCNNCYEMFQILTYVFIYLPPHTEYWRRKCNPLQYSCLQHPMDRGGLRATVRGVIKRWTLLNKQHTHVLTVGLPGGSNYKESACSAGDLGLIIGLGRSPGEGNIHPLQYACLENYIDRGAWQATVHRVAKIQT